MSEPCIYYHPSCGAKKDCPKVVCRAFFPDRQPLIQDSMQSICKSPEHVECERFIDGNTFQKSRKDAHIGCPFLTNTRCGYPDQWWCKGHVPPFIIGDDNNVESCKSGVYVECPNYIMGMKHIEEWRRLRHT